MIDIDITDVSSISKGFMGKFQKLKACPHNVREASFPTVDTWTAENLLSFFCVI